MFPTTPTFVLFVTLVIQCATIAMEMDAFSLFLAYAALFLCNGIRMHCLGAKPTAWHSWGLPATNLVLLACAFKVFPANEIQQSMKRMAQLFAFYALGFCQENIKYAFLWASLFPLLFGVLSCYLVFSPSFVYTEDTPSTLVSVAIPTSVLIWQGIQHYNKISA